MQQPEIKKRQKVQQKAKHAILTQNLLLGLRKIKLHWLVLILLVPLFGLLAAFGNASNGSQTNPNNYIAIKTVVEDVTLPLAVTTVNHNAIVLKHEGGISMVYGHLSAFVAGLHKGQQVAQSAIIGFVGMTGLATGPHLHYEFLIGGTHHDPLTVALPMSIPIDAKYQQAFDAMSLDYMAQIEMLNRSQIAAKD